MVLESGVLPSQLRLYAAAAAASGNSAANSCFQPNPMLPPHHLFPHFAARFPINLATGFGLPPFLNHQNASFRFGGNGGGGGGSNPNHVLSSRNLEHNINCNVGRASESNAQRKRQRHNAASPISDDSASESHSPTKGTIEFLIWAHNFQKALCW